MTVTVSDVLKIYPSAGSADLSGYLATAQLLVSEQLSGKGLSSALLDQITLYLAAHFAEIGFWHGGLARQKVGNADETYNPPLNTQTGFKATAYGQNAMILDSSGTLASIENIAKTLPALFTVIGDGVTDGYA